MYAGRKGPDTTDNIDTIKRCLTKRKEKVMSITLNSHLTSNWTITVELQLLGANINHDWSGLYGKT